MTVSIVIKTVHKRNLLGTAITMPTVITLSHTLPIDSVLLTEPVTEAMRWQPRGYRAILRPFGSGATCQVLAIILTISAK
jgi:hypothetical protein